MHADDLDAIENWPSPAEVLAGDFPSWNIWREVDAHGHHGDWVAQHVKKSDRMYRASSIPALRALLEKRESCDSETG